MKRKYSLILAGAVLVLLVLLGAYILSQLSWDFAAMREIFSSQERFREFVMGFGVWAPLIFFLSQVLQVIISPIPGNITGLVGGAAFGWLGGFLLNGSGIVIGSIIAFFLARALGQGIVVRLIGKEIFNKYNTIFQGRFLFGLFLLFVFPFFPDDALCFLAGLSSLPFPVFLMLIVVGRLPGMFVAALAGAGVFVFSLHQWLIVGAVSLTALYFLMRNRERLEAWIYRKLRMGAEEGKAEKTSRGE